MNAEQAYSGKNIARVGIMGGTFNPIHYGHLLLAENAREVLGLERILFVPSGISYMKDVTEIPDGTVRAHMIELAIQDNPHFSLSRMELERSGPTYTCDTIRELREEHPENHYFFLMGADNLLLLKKWKNYTYILENCTIAVAARAGEKPEMLKREADWYRRQTKSDIQFLPERSYDISSSEIRDRIAEKKSVRYLLPSSVADYIQESHLYQRK